MVSQKRYIKFMQLASLAQIRAARALLNWTQSDLARAAKLSLAAVNNLERDASNPRLNTLVKIQAALETHGVEFQQGPGVRLRGEVFNITTIDRGDIYAQFLNDILTTCLTQQCRESYYINMNDADLAATSPIAFAQYARDLQKYDLHERVLVEAGDTQMMFPPSNTRYRWLPKALFGVAPFALYGNKLALILWGPPTRAVIIENPSVAASYAKQFEFFWAQAKDPPYTEKQLYEMSTKLLPLN